MRSSPPYHLVWLLSVSLLVTLGACGTTAPPPPDQESPTSGKDIDCVDVWSFVHFTSGYLLGLAIDSDSFVPTYAALLGWELLESSIWPGWGESEVNQHCDMYAGSYGWLIAQAASE